MACVLLTPWGVSVFIVIDKPYLILCCIQSNSFTLFLARPCDAFNFAMSNAETQCSYNWDSAVNLFVMDIMYLS